MSSIAPDQLSEFGATGVLILIAIIFGVIAILKGIARLIFNLAAAAIASGAGYYVHSQSDSIIEKLGLEPQPWMPYAIASVAGIGAVFALRFLFRTFFYRDEDGDGKKEFSFKAGFIGLLIGCGIVFSGVTGIRYADAKEQLSDFKKQLEGKETDKSLITRAREFLESSKLGKTLAELDFITDSDQVKAAKLLLAQKLGGKKPSLGSMDNPLMAEAVSSDELQKDIDSEDFSALLNSDAVKKLLADPEVRKKLQEMDPDDLLKR